MSLGRNDKEDTMSNPVRKKLDELKELRQENYITEEEYAAARGNALLDAGFDIVPRTGLEARFRRPTLQEGESGEKKNGGCGCFLILLLLIVILFGGIFALPEDTLKLLPGLDRVFGLEMVQEARRTVLQFVDDLMGRPQAQESPILPTEDGADRISMEPAVAVPEPSSERDGVQNPPKHEDNPTPAEHVEKDVLENHKDALENHAEEGEPQEEQEASGDTAASADSDAAPPQAATVSDDEPSDTANSVRSSVWGNSVRIRSTPDRTSDGNIVGRARKGEELTILEETTNDDGERWLHIRMDQGDREGWMLARLVRPVKDK